MWNYWRDKYGRLAALKEYYPNLLKSRDDLRQSVAQVENANRAIDAVMDELQERAEDEDAA
jgi:hypothetical protein